MPTVVSHHFGHVDLLNFAFMSDYFFVPTCGMCIACEYVGRIDSVFEGMECWKNIFFVDRLVGKF